MTCDPHHSESIDDALLPLIARCVRASSCPFLITNREGEIVYVNPVFSTLTGYSLDELKGQTPRVFKSPNTPLLIHQDLWNTISAGKPWRGELCNRRKGGGEYWESIVINPVKNHAGEITHYVGIWQDITVRRRNDENILNEKTALERQSRTDDLTGLYNRRHIFIEVEREVERSVRYGRPLSCMMIDIDDFKKINDTYGHFVGDQVVQTFARLLEDSIRTIDILGRYGGDEFLLILPETDLDEARSVAERIRSSVIDYQHQVMAELGPLTVSIGLVVFDESCRANKKLFIEKADAVLMAAKRSGKNQIIVG